MASLTTLTLSEAAALVAARDLSPVELAEAHLARIERIDPLVNSFITITADLARQQAREAEEAIARGEYRGPLHGLPLALKDLVETAGVRTTAGSRHLADFVPDADSTVAARLLREQGAVLLGKLNMHEWAMSVTNRNPHYGDCHNPWQLDHLAGGSSGGSAAALAAELCLGALGSDTAGSIRIPAAHCGVVGLKPTYGRVPTRGVLPLSWSLDHVGPMARRVRDVSILLQALAGHDPDDPGSVARPVDAYGGELEAGVQGWRVALALDHVFPPDRRLDPEVEQATRAAAAVFEALGATVEELSLPLGDVWPSVRTMLLSDARAFHSERLATESHLFGTDVRAPLEDAAHYTGAEYARVRQGQRRLRRHLERFFQTFDLLLTPTTPAPAPPLHEASPTQADRPSVISYTAPWNFVGFPALSVPSGFTEAGLPIGLQLVAGPWQEAHLLRAGHAYEQATPWHTYRPAL